MNIEVPVGWNLIKADERIKRGDFHFWKSAPSQPTAEWYECYFTVGLRPAKTQQGVHVIRRTTSKAKTPNQERKTKTLVV